jgi:hypothetical protein
VVWEVMRERKQEPIYAGQPLSQLLYSGDPDFEWMPNDFYGHVHDELWYLMVAPPTTKGDESPTSAVVLGLGQEPAIDTNAIPWLLRWMRARETAWDHALDRMARPLPWTIARWVDPYVLGGWKSRAGRWHIAAGKGFGLLGTNAEPALPELSNLLYTTEADLPLTSAIDSIGRQGMGVLTNAIVTTTNKVMRDNAALALGMNGEWAKAAIPALVTCVEQGHASYHVLGAIGRIGGHDPRLVAALVRLLEDNPLPPGAELHEDMAYLVLGLQGKWARPAVPVLLARYRLLPEVPGWPQRRLLRRVLRTISPETEAQLPPATKDELQDNWP